MNKIIFGDCRDSLRQLAADGVKVQTCVTSPPYFGLRDYGVDGQIGLEETPEQFVAELVEVFRCVRDVLADDGTLWVNIGDSYDKSSASLHGIPWLLAFALRGDGWVWRGRNVWDKPNAMPEPVRSRCASSHEFVLLFTKVKSGYYFDHEAIKEPAVSDHGSGNGFKRDARLTYRDADGARGNDKTWSGVGGMRNRRDVWRIPVKAYKGAHDATFPEALAEPCILAGSRPGDIVLDPFMGSGTTAAVALKNGRQYVGCELNEAYKPLQDERIEGSSYQESLL